MIRTRRLGWLVLLATLSACGGGEDSETAGSNGTSSGSSVSPTLSINEINDQDVTSAAFYYKDWLETFAFDATTFYLWMREDAESSMTLSCAVSGTLVLTLNAVNNLMTATYNQCAFSTGSISGHIDYEVKTFNETASQQSLSLLLSTNTFSISVPEGTLTISGSETASLTRTNSSDALSIEEGNFNFSGFGFTGKVQQFSEAYSNNYASGTYSIAFSGTVDDSIVGGSFSFATDPPLTGSFYSYPEAGQLTFVGAGNTSTRITPAQPENGVGYPNAYVLQTYSGQQPVGVSTVGSWTDYFAEQQFTPLDSTVVIPSRTPSLSATPSSINVSLDTDDPNPFTYQNVYLNVKDPPAGSLFVSVTSGRSATRQVSAGIGPAPSSGVGVAAGSATIELYAPSIMGSGTYTDVVEINVCLDAACTQHVANSPMQIPVTYTVTGNPVPYGSISATTTNIVIEADSHSNVGPTAAINFSQIGEVPYGFTYVATPGTSNIVSSTSGLVDSNGPAINVTMKAPGLFVPGNYHDTLQLKVCKDAACTVQLTGSPLTFNLTYVVPAQHGRDFMLTRMTEAASDLAWNQVGQRLLVAAPFNNGQGRIRELDPSTETVTRSIDIATTPTRIVVSANGQYAYFEHIQPNGACCAISRLRLSDFVVDQTLNFSAYEIGDFEPAPGSAQTLAISLAGSSNGTRQVVIYDNTTLRTQVLQRFDGNSWPYGIKWGATADTLYVADENPHSFARYSVSATGLATSATATYTNAQAISLHARILSDSGKFYSDTGAVFDPNNMTMIGEFDLATAITRSPINDSRISISASGGAIFGFGDFDGNQILPTLKTFDAVTLAHFAHLRLSDYGASIGPLAPCGTQCLAVGNGNEIIFIKGSFAGP